MLLKHLKTLRGERRNGLSKTTLLDNHFSARRLRRLARSEIRAFRIQVLDLQIWGAPFLPPISRKPQALQSWRPSKEVPKPWPGKVPKKVLRKVPVRNGVPRKVPTKVLRVPRLCRGSLGDGARSTFFGTFLGTPFRTGTFRSTFFGTFPGQGFGTSLDGRQDCNACFKGIWGKLGAKMGRPKFADPTPHGSNPPL